MADLLFGALLGAALVFAIMLPVFRHKNEKLNQGYQPKDESLTYGTKPSYTPPITPGKMHKGGHNEPPKGPRPTPPKGGSAIHRPQRAVTIIPGSSVLFLVPDNLSKDDMDALQQLMIEQIGRGGLKP